ncbi:general secretion pathway protein GspF [Escherichia coli]|nr:general secretion pathway protein GspF [Escherichia coli]
MALFYYQARERNGRTTKGIIEADSPLHVHQLLRCKEFILVPIAPRVDGYSGGLFWGLRGALPGLETRGVEQRWPGKW